MAMDQDLAAIFGTNQEQQPQDTSEMDDMEKLAQLTLLDAYATQQGTDLSHLSQDEALELAGQVVAEQEKVASSQVAEPTEMEKTAEENFNEFAYGGKIFAHSATREFNEIQKEAAGVGEIGKAARLARLGEHAKNIGGAIGRGTGALRTGEHKELRQLAKTVRKGEKAPWLKKELRTEQLKRLGKGVATAAGVGGAGAGVAAAGKRKESAAVEQLANARAYEILQAHGLADNQGNVVPPDQLQEKTAADQLNATVDDRAWEIIKEAGYPVDEG